ncbi:TIGR04222 domain-containing membrane protein [Kitasatospora sp. NPDC096147]|uniref:TIGR04222 domain-containing membrane protein n=1 Tax=Kitasatospora sp. NPDC096147 TaxID=3364093 RepID=UPI00380A637D
MGWWSAFGLVHAAALVCLFRFARARRTAMRAPLRLRCADEDLTLHELAYLRGRGQAVPRVALAAMMLAGRLVVDEGARTVTVTDPDPRDAVEADVVQAIGSQPSVRTWEKTFELGRSRSVVEVGNRLGDQGLVLHPDRFGAFERARNWLSGSVFGCVVLDCALIRPAAGDPQAFWLLGASLFLGGVWCVVDRKDRWGEPGDLTDDGRSLLERHEGGGGPWLPRAIADGLTPGDADLLAAVVRSPTAFTGKLRPLGTAIDRPVDTSRSSAEAPGLGGGV